MSDEYTDTEKIADALADIRDELHTISVVLERIANYLFRRKENE